MHKLPTDIRKPLLLHGDCIEHLRHIPDACIDVVVSDPPAGIGFMGKQWDSFKGYKARTTRGVGVDDLLAKLGLVAWERGFVTFLVDVWAEVDRVLKPGAVVCAWALPKTADLAGLALRLTGWRVQDSVLHLFGQGMNKTSDVGKQIDKKCDADGQPATDDARRWTGWYPGIAPGHEQWLIARKPTPLTCAKQATTHGCGLFNVDGCRIPRGDADIDAMRVPMANFAGSLHPGGAKGRTGDRFDPSPNGSHPRNVILTRGGENCPVEGLDLQSGILHPSGQAKAGKPVTSSAASMWGSGMGGYSSSAGPCDSGGASRYFTRFDEPAPFDERVKYCAKASDRSVPGKGKDANRHNTHKHPELMRWLVTLTAATSEQTGGEPAIVLDPFMGSGTTGLVCPAVGVRFVGIEADEGSFATASARITYAAQAEDLQAYSPKRGEQLAKERRKTQREAARSRK